MFWSNDEEDSCGGYQCSRLRNKYKTPTNYCDDDKENMDTFVSKDDSELCLYDASLPSSSDAVNCQLFEDHDPNSLDSGYAATNSDSPQTLSSESFDEVLLDISELSNDDENAQLPDFNKLMSTLQRQERQELAPAGPKSLKRSLSMVPTSSKARSCLFQTCNENLYQTCGKRSPPWENESPKRPRVLENVQNVLQVRKSFMRSITLDENSIKSALQRESTEQDLIGDFSREFCLPLVSGRHQDLKSISPTTLAMLINGHFGNNVASFKVIDCRYPYEYNGGHVSGSINLYTKEQVFEDLFSSNSQDFASCSTDGEAKRHILVFHCEFSSERGPNLSRFLRNMDRMQNKDSYPFLHYPEIYLLDGGYKNFYEQYSELCLPDGYLPMLHPEHGSDLKHFRTKSKTFNCDSRLKVGSRSSLFKRL